ncbi:MAG: ribonuclease P protein component [bacterium]|nr:ribonuclease P protein component [bacterium]
MNSLTGRFAYSQLRASGSRIACGVVWIQYLLEPDMQVAQIGYALPRRLGPAVVRNKIRRRLRHIVTDIDKTMPEGLMGGCYLIGVRRGIHETHYEDLRMSVNDCFSAIERSSSAQVAGDR